MANTVSPHIAARHRVSCVGNMLVKGPFSIKPPRLIDDYGWLECQLRLTHWSAGAVESVGVYVDDSTNREEDFLAPVLRHVRWERPEDLRRALAGELGWPTATISLSSIGERRDTADTMIQELVRRVAWLPVVPFGLSADRAVPAVDIDERVRMQVYVSNGVQNVEFDAPTSGSDGGLSDLVLNGIATFRELIAPIDLAAGWRESYPYPLTAEDLQGFHWWDHYVPGQS